MTSLLLLFLAATPAPADHVEAGAIISLPQVGLVLSPTDTPGVAIFLPWVLRLVSEDAQIGRPSQLVLEAGAVIRAISSFTFRVGLRWLRDPLPWLAVGGGVGMGLEVGALGRPVSSAELVARLGTGPLYFWMVTARAELRMDGTSAFMLALGRAYW